MLAARSAPRSPFSDIASLVTGPSSFARFRRIHPSVPALRCLEASFHVGVCDVDELSQRDIIHRVARPELDVPHELAGAFEQTVRVGEFGAAKEADIHVVPERIDVTKRGVSNACRRMSVMQELPDIVSAIAHDLEPALRDQPQFARMFAHPRIDGWLSLDRTVKPQDWAHCDARAFCIAGNWGMHHDPFEDYSPGFTASIGADVARTRASWVSRWAM